MEGMGQLLNINNYIFTYLLNSLKKNVQALYYYNLLLDRDWNKIFKYFFITGTAVNKQAAITSLSLF